MGRHCLLTSTDSIVRSFGIVIVSLVHFHRAIAKATSLSLSLFPLSDSDTLALLKNGYSIHSKFGDSDVAIAFAWWKQSHRQQWNPIFSDVAIAQWKWRMTVKQYKFMLFLFQCPEETAQVLILAGFECESRGEIKIKGKDKPIHTYLIHHPDANSSSTS